MIELPVTSRGLFIALCLILLGIVAIYASTMWTVVLAAIVLALVGYLAYIVGYRVDRALKNGF